MSELKVDILQEVANSGAFSINTMDLTHTPMWYGKLGADQTIARATDTTVTPFTGGSTITEPSTCFDGTTFTVPSSDDVSYAGAYYIFAQIIADFSDVGNDGEAVYLSIRKNGNEISSKRFGVLDEKHFIHINQHLEVMNALVAGDEITVSVYVVDNDASANGKLAAIGTNFGGFRLTEV